MSETTEKKQCECDVCQHGRRFQQRLELIPEAQRAYFEELYDAYLNVSADLDYYQAIVKGAWPGAVSILESALVRAKEKQAEWDAAK